MTTTLMFFVNFKKKIGVYLYNHLLNQLYVHSVDNTQKTINFDVKNKKGNIEKFQYVFFQKRRNIYINNYILTIPWVVFPIK